MRKLLVVHILGGSLALSVFAGAGSSAPAAGWAVSLTVSPSTVQVNGLVTWSGVVTNNGVAAPGQAVELLGHMGPDCGGTTYGGNTFATDASGAYSSSSHIALSPNVYSFQASVLDSVTSRNVLARSGCVNLTVTAAIPDTVPPTLTMPGDVTAEATGPNGATVAYTVSATDDHDPSPAVVCSPPSGSAFPLGATTVSCTATDANGNHASATITVTVVDRTPPVLTLPADMLVRTTGSRGALVSYTATARDIVDPSPVVRCSPPSGTRFAIGTTTVDCKATDASGNSARGSFAVKVVAVRAAPLIGAPTIVPGPIAAKRVTVTFRVRRGDTGAPLLKGTMICTPSVAGKVIPHAETFANGLAKVTFVVPATARGKVLSVKLTIKAQGGTTTKVAAFVVR